MQVPSAERDPESVDPLWPLFSRIQGGDEEALAALYDATSRRVFGLTLAILKDRALAEEATLETYTQVWTQAAHYDASRGRGLVWLLTIARSRAVDTLRARRREAERREELDVVHEFADPGAGPEATARGEERTRRIRSALGILPPGQRELVAAAFFGGLTHVEIARALGQPLGTVKTRIRTALTTLREALRGEAEHLA